MIKKLNIAFISFTLVTTGISVCAPATKTSAGTGAGGDVTSLRNELEKIRGTHAKAREDFEKDRNYHELKQQVTADTKWKSFFADETKPALAKEMATKPELAWQRLKQAIAIHKDNLNSAQAKNAKGAQIFQQLVAKELAELKEFENKVDRAKAAVKK